MSPPVPAGPAPSILDETYVYYTGYYAGTVSRVAKVGGPVTVLASGLSGPCRLRVADGNVYWSNDGNGGAGSVMRVPVSGGVPVTIANAQTPGGIAVDATFVYWTDSTAGTVSRAPR